MPEQTIRVHGARAVGNISIEEARISGQGGPGRPHLVVPATVSMVARPDDSALALTELRAALRPGRNSFPWEIIGELVTRDMATGFLGWSRPDIENKTQVEFRFPLTATDIEGFEHRRHQGDGRVQLALFLDPVIEGVIHFNEQHPGRENPHKGPWDDPLLGMYSQRFTFWTSTVDPIPLEIEMSHWVETILPQLGYNQLRLIELRLPPPLPGHEAAAVEFDRARLAFDQRRYADCVSACRGLINMWNRLLESTKAAPMGSVAGDRLGWPADDPRREFLSRTWVATLEMVNVSLHPEGRSDPQAFTAPETRLLFRQVGLLSEYLASLAP